MLSSYKDSNPRPLYYEPDALPLSYRAQINYKRKFEYINLSQILKEILHFLL